MTQHTKYNYWKCRIYKRNNKVRPWIVKVIETDAIVIRCGTWQKAVKRAIRFQEVQNRTKDWGAPVTQSTNTIVGTAKCVDCLKETQHRHFCIGCSGMLCNSCIINHAWENAVQNEMYCYEHMLIVIESRLGLKPNTITPEQYTKALND